MMTLGDHLIATGWRSLDGGFYSRGPISLFIGELIKSSETGKFLKAWIISREYSQDYRAMGEIVLTPENIEDTKELFNMPSDEIDAYFTALSRMKHDS